MRSLVLLLGGFLVLAGCGRSVPYEGRSIEDLRRQLGDPDVNRQAQAATGLSLHGAAALPAFPDLVPLLQSESSLVRQQAVLALGAMGPSARAATDPLTRCLNDAEWTVRRQAALALGKIGPEAKAALPTLRRLAQSDPQGLVKTAAREARENIERRP